MYSILWLKLKIYSKGEILFCCITKICTNFVIFVGKDCQPKVLQLHKTVVYGVKEIVILSRIMRASGLGVWQIKTTTPLQGVGVIDRQRVG